MPGGTSIETRSNPRPQNKPKSSRMKSTILPAVMGFIIAANAHAATVLNTTTFDGTEPTSDGNLTGFADIGTNEFDAVNGWIWATDFTGVSGGPANGGILSGLGTIKDQEIRVGGGLELVTGSGGSFDFGFGNSAHQLALAQGFTVNLGETVTVTYDMAVTGFGGGMYLYVDNGSGTYGFRDHTMTTGTGNTFSFVATGTDIRIAVRGNDGADSNASLQFIKVESVPEPGVFGLIGLGGLAFMRRRR